MKRTQYIQQNIFGAKLNMITYESIIPSPYWLIFYHGLGEKGLADGSQINKLEVHGPLKHAKAGHEYPFNLIAAQASVSHTHAIKYLPAYVRLKYNAKVIGVTGLSMGGFATFDTPLYDDLKLVRFIAPVCGGRSITELNPITAYPDVIGFAFHGDADSTIRYTRSESFVNAYNATHGEPDFKYRLYPGVGHNAWDKAYSIANGEDELTQWFNLQFNEAPQDHLDLEAFRNRIIDAVKAVQ